MNATEELYRVIEILQQGILLKNVVVIHARAKATEQFIRRLEIENIIAVLRSEAHAFTIEVNKFITDIAPVERVPVKAKDLLKSASMVLPSITGNIIISTPKGIQTHLGAYNQRLGGRVLAIIY